MEIRIAFYKKSKTLFWRLICFQQRRFWIPERYARYSHVEIDFFWEHGSFSSSEQDEWVRFKQIEWNPENWDFIELDVSKKNFERILTFCKKEEGNRYGKVGIFFAQILNFNLKRRWTWFCSEIVTRALQEAWMCCPLNSLFTKPAELALYLEKWEHIITK